MTIRAWLLATALGLAVVSGIGAHVMTDRQPLLLPMSIAVFAAAYALTATARPARLVIVSLAAGAALWGLEQVVYAITHVAAGDEFTADRFGPQWLQALALIGAHATLIGLPSGLVAALVLLLPPIRKRREAGRHGSSPEQQIRHEQARAV